MDFNCASSCGKECKWLIFMSTLSVESLPVREEYFSDTPQLIETGQGGLVGKRPDSAEHMKLGDLKVYQPLAFIQHLDDLC